MSSPRQKTAGSRSISSQIPWRMASRYVVWDMLLLLVTIVICAAPQHRTDNTRPGRALLASTGEGACAHVVRLISNALRPLFASDVQRASPQTAITPVMGELCSPAQARAPVP